MMKTIKRLSILVLLLTLSVSCASVNPLSGIKGDTLQEKVGNDLSRGSELATKYGNTEISTCLTYLNKIAGNGDTLLNEPTAGVISFAVKAYLLKNSSVTNEAAFKTNCGAMSAGIMIEAAKQAPISGNLIR